jgi:hypothetical protein
MHQLIAGKSYLHGTDIDGRPVCWVTAGLHFAKDQTERDIQRFTIYTMETARLMLRSPVDTACVVFDMSDFSINNMDYAPVRFMIDCFEAHYPESLGVCCIHKAPWVFQGIWVCSFILPPSPVPQRAVAVTCKQPGCPRTSSNRR